MNTTPAILTGTEIGQAGSYQNNSAHTFQHAFGGPTDWYDSANANGGWVGLDLQTPHIITGVNLGPRPGWNGRVEGAQIQASNVSNFSTTATLATIPTSIATKSYFSVSTETPYRYVRYKGADGTYCNVNQLSFIGFPYPVSVSTANQVGTNAAFGSNFIVGANNAANDPSVHPILAMTQAAFGMRWVKPGWAEYPEMVKTGDNYWTVCRNWKKLGYKVALTYNGYADHSGMMPPVAEYMDFVDRCAAANASHEGPAVDAILWGNEFDSTTGQVYYKGTIPQLVTMLQAVTPIATAAGILNVAPSTVHGIAYQIAMLEAGVFKYCPIADQHLYNAWNTNVTQLQQWVAWCAENDLQCWCSETGFSDGNLVEHAANMKNMLVGMSNVNAVVFPFSQVPNGADGAQSPTLPSPLGELSAGYPVSQPEYDAWLNGMTVPA